MHGVHNQLSSSGTGVLIGPGHGLGTTTSSIRFKRDVEDMGEVSELLKELRPVTFRYREEAGGDGVTPEYGLIAEEVAAVAPELVVYDEHGEPETVKYHLLSSLLLNELQKHQQDVRALQRRQVTDRLLLVVLALVAAVTFSRCWQSG